VDVSLKDRRTDVGELYIDDVRPAMPNYDPDRVDTRRGEVLGIAIHHSGTADARTGLSADNARTIAEYHVGTLGWDHPGYHYVVLPNGVVEYALDERIPAYHAGFTDPEDRRGLESGQFWNHHYLAICVAGWFDDGRHVPDKSSPNGARPIPDYFTRPAAAQFRALMWLVQSLKDKYNLAAAQVRGHRELEGCSTACPGRNFDLDSFRRSLADQ